MTKVKNCITILIICICCISTTSQTSFFIPNEGQIVDQYGKKNSDVKYVISLKGYNVSLYNDHFAYELFKPNKQDSSKTNAERIEVWFDNSNPLVEIVNTDKQKEVLNVFKSGKKHSHIPTYSSIRYHNIYEGVSIDFFIDNGKLKYNYVVENIALKSINLKVKGAKVSKKNRDLYFTSKNNQIIERIPTSYFITENGKKNKVDITLNTANNRIQYLLPQKRKRTLVIDPIAYGNEYSTYYGGSGLDFAKTILTNKINQTILSGYTASTNNIATTGAFQNTLTVQDAFIACFDEEGTRLWSTYFGGEDQERSFSAALDSNDNIYLTGGTTSQIGIATNEAYQQFIKSGDDAFIAKFSPNGILNWSTYYGGNGHEVITKISIDDSNKLYVTGHTASSDLTCTPNAFRSNLSGSENAFLGVFDTLGNIIYNSYYIKGSNTRGESISISKTGNIYLGGYTNDTENSNNNGIHQQQNGGFLDGFVLKINSQFQTQWKTYLGGEVNDLIDGIAIDSLENIYIVGKTRSTVGIATSNSLQSTYTSNWDGFLVKLDSAGSRKWGTYINGGSNDELIDIEFKSSLIWILGITNGDAFTIDSSAYQMNNKGGFDNLILKFSDTGSLLWSSYFGGNGDDFGNDLSINKSNKILIAGQTSTFTNLATTNGHQTLHGGNLFDGYWTKLCQPLFPTILSESGIINLCQGDSLTVNSTNSFEHYLWSNGDTTNNINITQSGDYVLKTKDANQCPGRSDTLIIKVIPKEIISIQNSGTAVCENDSILLFIDTSYSTFNWSNGKVIDSIYIKDSSNYSLLVTDRFGCEYSSDTVSFPIATLNYPISILGDTVLCMGGEAILFTNENFTSITWNNNESTNAVTVSLTGQYLFSAIDTNQCQVYSDTTSITTVNNPTPNSVLDTTLFFNRCENDSVILIASTGFENYEWSNGEQNQNIIIKESGVYLVTATDTNGCAGISDSISVQFNSLPLVEILPIIDTICLKDSIYISSSNSFESYNWSNGVTAENFYLYPTSEGEEELFLEVIDSNNCKANDTINYYVLDCEVFNTVNEEFTQTLTVANTGNIYLFKNNEPIQKIEIYNLEGKIIKTKEIKSKNALLDLNFLSSGTYIANIFFKNYKQSFSQKLIVLK